MRYEKLVAVGGLKVLIGAWSPGEYFVSNWSLKQVRNQNDVSQGDAEQQRFVRGLRYALYDMNIKKAYAPKIVPPTGRVVDIRSLTQRIQLGGDMCVCRGKDPADGIRINPEEGFLASLGGCPLIIAVCGELMIVAHAALDSMIHPDVVLGRKSITEEPGIVNAVINEFLKQGASVERISMCMVFSIPLYKRQFNHSIYGPGNIALWGIISKQWPAGATRKNGDMILNLEGLFTEQARRRGVQDIQTTLPLTEFPDLPHTYDGKSAPNLRYLAIVKRDS